MNIGIISDVHSNILALEETFKMFENEKVDKIICIGDVIGIGPYPEKCIDFLIKNQDKIISFVIGNHEGYLINGIPRRNHNDKDAKPLTDEEISTHIWNHSRLNKQQVEYIRNLKIRDKIEVNGKKIVIEHFPMDENNKFKQYIKNPTPDEISELFDDKEADIYLFGHTHFKYYAETEGKHYINPGSLGCPINSNGANAGIIKVENDKIEYKQLEVEYDIQKVINDIKALNYPLCDFMINTFYKKN